MRVALVVDSHNWCFGHMARGIQNFAPPEYDVQVLDGTEFSLYTNEPSLLERSFDAVCQFSWPESSHRVTVRNCVVVAHEGILHPRTPIGWKARMLVSDMRNSERAHVVLPRLDAVLCFTQRLADFASTLNDNVIVCPPAVDTTVFRPKQIIERGRLRIGWCGQPALHKGTPIIDWLQRLLPYVEWNINSRHAGKALPMNAMAEWHSQNDVFLCTSYSEGGPLTVLEALACGVPVVSTPVGIVPTIQQGATLLPAVNHYKDVAVCVRAAHEILSHHPVRTQPDAAALAESKRWSWEVNAERWLKAICG